MFNLLLWVILIGTGVLSATHALLNKREPRSALGWIVLCLTLPGLGALGYWLFGANRISYRVRRWQARGRMRFAEAGRVDAAKIPLPPSFRSEHFISLLSLSDAVTRRPLVPGNRVELLHNGEAAYPAMLEAIARARVSVHLSSYIFDSDRTGQAFCDQLAAAVARGVEVKVLVDALGEHYSLRLIHREFQRRGIPYARFLPFTLFGWGFFVNLRNHRKLLIVDNEVGFTGGMNISDRHLADDLTNPHRVVDLHFRVQGPVVGQMLEAFLEDWAFASGNQQVEPPYWPYPLPDGASFCRGISVGPNEDFEQLTWILVGALNCARSRVAIMTPYFIPDRALISALCTAALRGVQVEIILPGKNNLPFVDWASRAYLEELIEHRIAIYYQPPPFVHTKMLIVDQDYAIVGSANFDPRSLRLNFEFNLEICDPEVAGRMLAHFDAIRAKSPRVTLRQAKRTSLPLRLRNGFAKLFSPYL